MGSVQAPIETASMPLTPKVSTKRRLMLHGLATGQSIVRAAESAGMSRQAAHQAIADMREQMPGLLAEVGLDPRSILCRLREKADAKDKRFFVLIDEHGRQVITEREVDDNRVQMDALKTAAKMQSMLDGDSGVRIGSINIAWGQMPRWADPESRPVPACTVPVLDSNDASAVSTDSELVTDSERVPLSTIEGTGREPGGPTHANSDDSGVTPVLTRPDESDPDTPVQLTLSRSEADMVATLLQRMQSRNRKRNGNGTSGRGTRTRTGGVR